MKRNHWNIKKRIMAGFVVVLAVVSVVVTLLFRQTENKLRVEYRKLVQSSVEGAMHRLDMLVREVYSISDYFAFNNQLERYLDKTYTDEQVHVKRADVIRMYRDFFEASDILQKRQKISGILTTKGVLFNFEDVNCDGPEVAEQLIALGINKPEHLMRFCWYPLRDNFMVQDAAGDVRKDKAVFGSRRVYSVWKSAYICTHIFCIHEEDLYETYQESVVETKGEIYILDENGNLISSSNQECVQRGAVDETFRKKLLSRTEDDFTWKTRSENFEICVRQSEVNNWMTVAVIPQKNITGEVNALYLRIYVVLILCLIGCVVILLRMYQGFFTPVNELNQAMREVQMGNLNAYVKETGRNEIADMMRYYNNMLRSIHVHVVEKLESERRKKELELEVLVSQINPHFLYNTLENIVFPNPVLEGFTEGLLLLRGQGGLLDVENAPFPPIRVLYRVINADIPEIQRILQDAVGVGAAGSVGGMGGNVVVADAALAGNRPLRCVFGAVDLDFSPQIGRGFQGLIHKLLDVFLVDPVCSQPDLNLGGVQVLGLCGGQGLHVGPDALLLVRGCHIIECLGHAELLAHVAGKVFVGGDKRVAVQVHKGFGDQIRVLRAVNVPENYAGQLLFQLSLRFPGELCHKGHIHPGPLPNGDRQRVHCRVHAGDAGILLDGPLGEHIRFPLQLPVVIQHLQGAEQIVGGIPVKGQTVGPVIDEAEFLGESVVAPVQLPLLLPDGAVRGIFIHLEVNQLPHTLPQSDHGRDALPGRGGQGGLYHDGVFPVVNLTVHDGIGVIVHAGVRRDSGDLHFPNVFVQLRGRGLPVLAVNIFNRVMQLVSQLKPLYRLYGKILSAVLGTLCRRLAQDHLRVFNEVAVDTKSVRVFSGLYPRRFLNGWRVPLLQENNVGNHLGSGIGLESVIRQADSPQQISLAAHFFAFVKGFFLAFGIYWLT